MPDSTSLPASRVADERLLGQRKALLCGELALDALHDADADANGLGSLYNPSAADEEPPHRLIFTSRYHQTAQALPRCPRARQAGSDALDNYGALELGEHTHHLKHCLAGRGGRVDPLLVQLEIDPLGMQLAQDPD
jgi:hypothetical protein